LGPYANQVTREYVMTALMKLTSRLSDGAAQSKIRELLAEYSNSMEVEIQQRAVEYTNLFSYDAIRPAVLERMPVPETRTIIQSTSSSDEPGHTASSKAGPSDQDLLLDLMGVGTASSSANMEVSDMPASPVTATPAPAQKQSNVDLLADLFGSSSPAPSSPAPAKPTSNNDLLADLLGDSSSSTPATPATPTASLGLDSLSGASSPVTQNASASGYEAYTKNGLTIRLLPSRDRSNPAIINIQALFSNNGSQGVVSQLQFQAAVPKSQRLQMNTASSHQVQPNTTEKQTMRINNPQNVSRYDCKKDVFPNPYIDNCQTSFTYIL
jgi:AP-1 complex subunit gamma-1